jgi:hypothetical protein
LSWNSEIDTGNPVWKICKHLGHSKGSRHSYWTKEFVVLDWKESFKNVLLVYINCTK